MNPNTPLPTWEAPRFQTPDGAITEATEDWLRAHSETPEQALLRELKEAVRRLGEAHRAPIQGARGDEAGGTDSEVDELLASFGFERARR